MGLLWIALSAACLLVVVSTFRTHNEALMVVAVLIEGACVVGAYRHDARK